MLIRNSNSLLILPKIQFKSHVSTILANNRFLPTLYIVSDCEYIFKISSARLHYDVILRHTSTSTSTSVLGRIQLAGCKTKGLTLSMSGALLKVRIVPGASKKDQLQLHTRYLE